MTATIPEQMRQLADTMAAQPPNGGICALAPVRANLATAEMAEGVTDVGLIPPDTGLLYPHVSATTLRATMGDAARSQVFCWGAWCCGGTVARRFNAELVTELTSRSVGLAAATSVRRLATGRPVRLAKLPVARLRARATHARGAVTGQNSASPLSTVSQFRFEGQWPGYFGGPRWQVHLRAIRPRGCSQGRVADRV